MDGSPTVFLLYSCVTNLVFDLIPHVRIYRQTLDGYPCALYRDCVPRSARRLPRLLPLEVDSSRARVDGVGIGYSQVATLMSLKRVKRCSSSPALRGVAIMFVVGQGEMKKRYILDPQAQRRVTAIHSTQRWGKRDSSGVIACTRTKRSIVQV